MALKTTNSRKEEAPLGIAGSEDSKEVLRTLILFFCPLLQQLWCRLWYHSLAVLLVMTQHALLHGSDSSHECTQGPFLCLCSVLISSLTLVTSVYCVLLPSVRAVAFDVFVDLDPECAW